MKKIHSSKESIILTHTLLMDMGDKFKVLIQEKGGCEKRLLGLRFSNPELRVEL